MKNYIKILLLTLLITNSGCHAQQLMQKISDAQKIKINEQQFLNKPLKNLLKEIKPEIKMIYAGVNEESRGNYFRFKFVPLDENLSPKKEARVVLIINVKETFEWDRNVRLGRSGSIWTKEDAEKYGNLTVIHIHVSDGAEAAH